MNPRDYQDEVVGVHERPTANRFAHAVTGASSEVGELAAQLKNQMLSRARVPALALDEWGDLLYYMVMGLDADRFTLEMAMEWNLIKLRSRKEHGKDKEREVLLLEEYLREHGR